MYCDRRGGRGGDAQHQNVRPQTAEQVAQAVVEIQRVAVAAAATATAAAAAEEEEIERFHWFLYSVFCGACRHGIEYCRIILEYAFAL